MILSDRWQQLTLIRTSAATLFDVYLLFICSQRYVIFAFARGGGTPKIHRSLARNMSSQIYSEIPRPQALR
jgi:hypothetical protein